MEKARRKAVNSLRSTKILNAIVTGSPSAHCQIEDDERCEATSVNEKRSNRITSEKSSPNVSKSTEIYSTSSNQHDREMNKLKHDIEIVRSHAQSIEKENEILRGLLAFEPVKLASTFRRAIVMTVYPEEVVNVIGVHDRNDAIFVAVEVTLLNSENLPIQKVTTSFSDGRWQEEMKFILDTESKWIDGKLILELKQKMFASRDDPIIGTASISPRRCLDWLQEGGEHSVQLEMVRTPAALKDEQARTLLFLTVKVAAERVSTCQNQNIQGTEKQIIVHSHSLDAIESKIQIASQNELIVPVDVPGIPDVSDIVSVKAASPCHLSCDSNEEGTEKPQSTSTTSDTEKDAIKFQTVSKRISLMTRWKTKTFQKDSVELAVVHEAVTATSSTDDEEEQLNDVANTSSATSGRKLELAPNSNRPISSEFVESKAARLSFNSMVYQRRAGGSKVTLAPVLDDSERRSQMKILKTLDSELATCTSELCKVLEQRPDVGTLHSLESHTATARTAEPIEESAVFGTGVDPNFVASIKGVSFANQKLLAIIKKNRDAKCDAPPDSHTVNQKAVDSAVLQGVPLKDESVASKNTATQHDEGTNLNRAKDCWSDLGRVMKKWFHAAKIMLIRVFGRFRVRKRLATVQPIRDVLDVESEIEAMNVAEERRQKVYNTKLAAKKLVEELETANDYFTASKVPLDQDDGAIESKLVIAISRLKGAYFDLPNRAVKVTPVSAIVQVMKSLAAGNSTAHQRLTTIQNYLQSKWIDCESMMHIMTWIKSPPDEVKFFECMAMRVIDKSGLARIASKFIHTVGTKFVALKTVDRLLAMSNKNSQAREQRKAYAGQHDLPEEADQDND